MKIYFTASVFQKEQYGNYYNQIVSILEGEGHQVVHEHVTDSNMDFVNSQTAQQNQEYYKTVQKSISQADAIVAEVSFPSTLNIGHEVSLALSKGKPAICLYLKGKISAFFNGIKNDRLVYKEYTPETLEKILFRNLDSLKDALDTRFNFYISPEINNYLDWIAKTKKLPRAVFLRTLLEKQMRLDKDFKN